MFDENMEAQVTKNYLFAICRVLKIKPDALAKAAFDIALLRNTRATDTRLAAGKSRTSGPIRFKATIVASSSRGKLAR